MQVSDKNNRLLHNKLPIDQDEKILGIYKHHWFAYVSSWLLAAVIVIIIMGLAVVFTVIGGSEGALAQHKSQIISGAAVFSIVVLLATLVPVYLRSQEQMVLTEEALLQVLQPSLFSSKIDQLNLQRMDDVSVRQDFLGTVLGYGRITIETPGEQDNYEFLMLPRPQEIAREVTRAHENYVAALQSGRLSSSLGSSPQQAVPPQIDPAQYEQFLQYQQMVKAQQAATAPNQQPVNAAPASAPVPTDPTAPTNES